MRVSWLAVALLAGLGGVAQEPPAGEEPAPDVTAPLTIPEAAKRRPNPKAGDPEAAQRGGQLFTTQCAMCHGPRGDGKGDLVGRLHLKMPDLTDPGVQKRRTDGEWFYILTVGHGDMPGEGDRMPDDWKWDLVTHLRTLVRR
jgi:mono/diheme cytochrome c family protein